jgi:hypothetical protein
MNIFIGILHLLWFIYYRNRNLNPRNYFKHEVIMSNFVHAKEYDMIMYENFQFMNMHLFFN